MTISSPKLRVVHLLDLLFCVCVCVRFHHEFTYISLMTKVYLALHMFIEHLYILFCEMPLEVFWPFKKIESVAFFSLDS